MPGRPLSWIHDAGDRDLSRAQAAAFDEAGVDLSLVDWMLSLSPAERLRAMYEHGVSIARLLPDVRSD